MVTLEEFYAELKGRYYVYALCKPDGTPFYIGKGRGERIEAHEAEAKNEGKNTAKHQVIREIFSQKAKVGKKVWGPFANEKKAFQKEKQLIKRYGRENNKTGILTNLTDGGEGKTPDYSWQEWELDENGIRVVPEEEMPDLEDLAPPRYRTINDAIVDGLRDDGELAIKDWKKPEEWTGREMPLVAQWQGHGLTIQVFFSEDSLDFDQYFPRDDYKKRIMQSWYNQQREWSGEYEMSVIVRVLDGKHVIIRDRSYIYLKGFGPGLSTPRTPNPSKKRIATERRLMASILGRLAVMAYELEKKRVRYDFSRGRKDLTKELQAWIKYNSLALSEIALQLEPAIITAMQNERRSYHEPLRRLPAEPAKGEPLATELEVPYWKSLPQDGLTCPRCCHPIEPSQNPGGEMVECECGIFFNIAGDSTDGSDQHHLDRQHLYLTGQDITSEDLKVFATFTAVRYLHLDDTAITDAALAHLAGLNQLWDLNLANTQISDTGLIHLKGLTRLKDLDLRSNRITDAGLVHLKGLPRLERIRLHNTQVTDAGVAELGNALRETRANDPGVAKLWKTLPNCDIEH